MKTIRYRITLTHGSHLIEEVLARDINSGFAKALKLARGRLFDGEEMSSIEFWEVRS